MSRNGQSSSTVSSETLSGILTPDSCPPDRLSSDESVRLTGGRDGVPKGEGFGTWRSGGSQIDFAYQLFGFSLTPPRMMAFSSLKNWISSFRISELTS